MRWGIGWWAVRVRAFGGLVVERSQDVDGKPALAVADGAMIAGTTTDGR